MTALLEFEDCAVSVGGLANFLSLALARSTGVKGFESPLSFPPTSPGLPFHGGVRFDEDPLTISFLEKNAILLLGAYARRDYACLSLPADLQLCIPDECLSLVACASR